MVVFKEVLPNPSGSDKEGEWIKLTNQDSQKVSLSGWALSDKSGNTFHFSRLKPQDQAISPNEDIVIPYSVSKVSLNNSQEELFLKNSNGELEDTLSYKGPIGDDEIVFGDGFSNQELNADYTTTSLKYNAQANGLVQGSNYAISPIIAAIAMAIVFGIGASIFLKEFTNR